MVLTQGNTKIMNTSKSKLGIIGTVGVPAKYGGFETLAHQLVLQVSKQLDTTVYNSAQSYAPEERVETWEGAKIKYMPFKANGIQSIIYDGISMLHAAIFSDVLLILGVSGCIFLPIIKLLFNVKIIINVDGLEWRRSKWNGMAKLFLILSEKIAIKCADELVADNAAIQKYLYDEHGISSQLIEYGADHNQRVVMEESDVNDYPFLTKGYAFKVARIEPENNLDMILEAFIESESLPLVIVGNWDHSNYGKKLFEKYQSCENIHLLKQIYNPRSLNLLRSNASIYVHGHSAGGTNPSLVEAMYLGLPILSLDVIYNRVTTEHKAIYFANKEALIYQLENLNPVQLYNKALTMKSIADRRYCWNVIANKYSNLITGKVTSSSPVFQLNFPLQLQKSLQY